MGTALAHEPYVESHTLQRPAGFLLIAVGGAAAVVFREREERRGRWKVISGGADDVRA